MSIRIDTDGEGDFAHTQRWEKARSNAPHALLVRMGFNRL
jgi:hypothetical protein